MSEKFGEKLKELREQRGETQAQLAEVLGISTRQVQRYEEGSIPGNKRLIAICEHYKYDFFKHLPDIAGRDYLVFEAEQLVVREPNNLSFMESRKAKKLAIDEDAEGIYYVPIAAQAGYVNRYLDPIYLSQLEKFYLPGFPYRGSRYRVFDVKGDSMEPTYKEGYHLVCEMVDKDYWLQIADYYIYVIVLHNDIIVKRLYKKDQMTFIAISDNEEFYPQFTIKLEDINELWMVKRKMDWEMAPPKKFEIKI